MAGKTKNTASALKDKALPPPADILLRALSGPDDELGKLLLGIFIQIQAQDFGIPADQIPDDFGERVVEYVKTLEASTASKAAIEKALHKAAGGDFQAAGKFLRESITSGADTIALEKIARQYVPIGIRKSDQAKEFGSRGAASNREIGLANRQAILAAAKEILDGRTRKPTGRKLAGTVAQKTGIPFDTVRGHLQKLRKDKILD